MKTPRGDAEASVHRTDEQWCHDVVQDVSRTFAITMDLLEDPMSTRICVGYLVCRVADTIEDAAHIPPHAKIRLLNRYDEVLAPSTAVGPETFEAEVEPWIPDDDADKPEWALVQNTTRVMRTFESRDPSAKEAMRGPARELVQGLSTFMERHAATGGVRIKTLDELEEYCHYAAGTVGRLITNLVTSTRMDASSRQTLHDQGHKFGLLLQLVNIAKDVHDDRTTENNVYLPAAWLAQEGVTQDEVCDPSSRAAAAAVVERTTNHASTYLDAAESYLATMPQEKGNRLSAWGMPYLLAVGTLRELRERPRDAVRPKGVKLSREEVTSILTQLTADPTMDTITQLRRRIASGDLE